MGNAPELSIQSHKGPYDVFFRPTLNETPEFFPTDAYHVVIDRKVRGLYETQPAVAKLLKEAQSVLEIEATEPGKSLDKFPGYVERLLEGGVRRDQTLVAVGGGIIQDIVCFLASSLFRGMNWFFLPTTLLAQADSCIGSKSSINVGEWKNIMGTFTPPNRIVICAEFLKTLQDADIRSGIGEMLKVHMIASPEMFAKISRDYDSILSDVMIRQRYILESLRIKQRLIEEDEFDKGIRNILNYGHSFGHAIESATDFAVPHGIAVTIGMDMANYVAARMGRWTQDRYRAATDVLRQNAGVFLKTQVPVEGFMRAIGKDKKNIGKKLSLILPNSKGVLEKVAVAGDDSFRGFVTDYFTTEAKSGAGVGASL